ncbi:MAG: VWA domain-containing protein [Clostridia bacterium]|nr:VWA domain-containing protein [Clostridia bacterium]
MKKGLIIIIILMILIASLGAYLYKRLVIPSSIPTTIGNEINNSNSVGSFIGEINNDIEMGATDSIGTAGGSTFRSLFKSTESNVQNSASDSLGFSTGGARTINNFRENIENGYFPISTDITYNGLFYDYSFDTGNAKGNSNDLFYPSYSTAVSKDPISGVKEYFMTVGLNSNIKESDFVRPKLNLVVVLDISGSMSSSFNSYYYDGNYMDGYVEERYKSKMDVAKESVNILVDHLDIDDRFGLVTFESKGSINRKLGSLGDSIENVKANILNIKEGGGTNFEVGYRLALQELQAVENDEEYQNRIIVITDAMPNTGMTDSTSLMGMIEENSKKKIYTSFIGVGVDFNTGLIEKLGTVEGANYYSVHNEEEFKKQMGEDFDFMVTPLVFNLNLDFDSTDYRLEAVYGTDAQNDKKENIMHVNTLFPSKRNENGEVKGGIILLKLENNNNLNGNIKLKVSYEDGHHIRHENEQIVNFDNKEEYYDNTGIRKGILLTRYANLMKDWILFERSGKDNKFLVTENTGIFSSDYNEDQITQILGEHERTSVKLTTSTQSKELFKKMKEYFKNEIKELGDDTLEQEVRILDILS